MRGDDTRSGGGAGSGPAPRDSARWKIRAALRAWKKGAGRAARDATTSGAGGHVCVGLSGGADSLALTAAAVTEFEAVTAIVVDHGLQDGSADVAGHAAEQARALGADAVVVRGAVIDDGSGPEAAARTARYRELEAAREGRPVLLAHTLDDQAETVLLGLARGSGARSLRAMRAWTAPWGRPLLGVRSAVTRAACAELGLEPWVDPHNSDPAYTRVRVRTELLPLLDDIVGGGAAEALARTAELLAADDAELDSRARAALLVLDREGDLEAAGVGALSEALRGRVIHRWLAGRPGAAPTSAHVAAVAELVASTSPRAAVAIGGDGDERGARTRLVVAKRHGKLVVESAAGPPGGQEDGERA